MITCGQRFFLGTKYLFVIDQIYRADIGNQNSPQILKIGLVVQKLHNSEDLNFIAYFFLQVFKTFEEINEI